MKTRFFREIFYAADIKIISTFHPAISPRKPKDVEEDSAEQ